MYRDPLLFLDDIKTSATKIMRYTEGMDRAAFETDEKTVDAVVRNLAIIGEAVKKLPAELKDRHRKVEWRKMAGLRDFVVHEYFGIDTEILWDVVSNKIPELLSYVDEIISSEDFSQGH